MAEVSTSAWELALPTPTAQSKASVRVCSGTGPAVPGRSSFGVMDRTMQSPWSPA